MSVRNKYPPKWQNNLTDTLGNRGLLLLKNGYVSDALKILDIRCGFLYDLAIHQALQHYLRSLVDLQYELCVLKDNIEIRDQAKELINDIKLTYSIEQLTIDENQVLSELKSHLSLE